MIERPIIVNAVLVENDPMFAEYVAEDFKNLQIGVEVLSSEHEFRQRLDSWKQSPPDVFVLGTWVRWTHPAPDMPEPTQDVINEGYHIAAGLRMSRYLLQIPELQHVPVIITGFESDDEQFIQKDGSYITPGVFFVDKKLSNQGRLAISVRSLAVAFK